MNGTTYHYTESSEVELIITREQSRSYPWHMHMRHWTIGVVGLGNARLLTAAAVRRFQAGESFFVRPYEPHSLTVEPGCSLLVLCLDSQEALFGGLSHCGNLLQPKEKRVLERTIAACAEKTQHPIFRHPPLVAQKTLLDRSIQAVMRLMEDTPTEPLGIAQMAAYAGYSQWHFLRGFQRATGMTPHAFQLLCRLRLLRSMLRADTASALAAASAGFSDQSHMHKVFKRHHGMTPGQFKQASFKVKAASQ